MACEKQSRSRCGTGCGHRDTDLSQNSFCVAHSVENPDVGQSFQLLIGGVSLLLVFRPKKGGQKRDSRGHGFCTYKSEASRDYGHVAVYRFPVPGQKERILLSSRIDG